MRLFSFITVFLCTLFFNCAHADELSGTWKLDVSAEIFGKTRSTAQKKYDPLQIVNGKLILPGCTVKLEKKSYSYDGLFQPQLKQGKSSESFAKFMKSTFSFDMSKVSSYYQLEEAPCTITLDGFFVSGEKLILSEANTFLYGYTRVNLGTAAPSPSDTAKYAQKMSRLPYDSGNFFEVCAKRIPWVKRVPQATDKCGPAYFPYVAMKTDADPLVQLIGTHKYMKAGPQSYADYDNPFANGLHPLFLVFPPLKDVLLVRVDDFDKISNEDRDRFGGAYLAIKNGKVVDQLSDGCIMTTEYACVDLDGAKRYQLLESGKFKKM